MLRSFKYLIFIGIVTTSCSSSKKLNLWTKQSKIEEVRNFESQLNPNSEFLNQNVSLSESIYPRVKEFEMANPLIVKREKEGLLPVYVEYFYSKPDSVIRYVSYDWENNRYGNYFDRKKDWELQSKKLAEYNAEYDRIKKQLTSKFGQPMEQDSQPQEVKSEDGRPS